ncbi:MAG: Bug family tripartite tricarboxylate transporter substrate binding protein [Lautropia sp.]
MKSWRKLLCGIGMAALASTSIAQTYPSRPITLLLGFPAGGSVDVCARLIGQKLSERLSVPIVVENKAGAAGNIAAAIAARAPKDGYTMYVATSVNAVSSYLYKSMSYDTVKDFAPIERWITTSYILVVNPKLPIHSVTDLITYAKANPGKLNYGSQGIGSPAHLGGELLSMEAKVDMVHVPFKGGPDVMASILAGDVHMTFSPIPNALPLMKSGAVRAIAISGLNRSPLAPQLQTVAEQGYPGFNVISWYGTVAPAGTPQDVVDRLSRETAEVLGMKDVQAKLIEQGLEPAPLGPQGFQGFIADEIRNYSTLMSKARIQPL